MRSTPDATFRIGESHHKNVTRTTGLEDLEDIGPILKESCVRRHFLANI